MEPITIDQKIRIMELSERKTYQTETSIVKMYEELLAAIMKETGKQE